MNTREYLLRCANLVSLELFQPGGASRASQCKRASIFIAHILAAEGRVSSISYISATLRRGTATHMWVLADGHCIDVTASQFNSRAGLPRVDDVIVDEICSLNPWYEHWELEHEHAHNTLAVSDGDKDVFQEILSKFRQAQPG